MRIPLSWLHEFVAVPVGVSELASALTRCGFEVAEVLEAPAVDGGTEPVLDLEITTNRPDCLSVLGIAREVATRFRVPLRHAEPPACELASGAAPDGLPVTIEDTTRCPRYAAALADVTLGASPAWLVARLQAAGVRAINNVVDVTNYVMLEMGQPLHAFDLAKLSGPALRIRLARPGERLRTLDGVDRTLDGDMLVIADAERAQAVAGVMGGADSEVTGGTRTIVLESAYFQPQSVRRTSKRLGLSTEASYRFERGADPEAQVHALVRACALLERIEAGRARPGCIDERGPAPAPESLRLRHARITRVLGSEVDATEVDRILDGLGFEAGRIRPAAPEDGAPAWTVRAPSWRGDVSREVDLIEEVARHAGYDGIPATFPAVTIPPARPSRRLERDRIVRQTLRAAGFSECASFAFIDAAAAERFATGRVAAIANPLSEKFAVLRPSLLPGLLDAVGYNRRRGRASIRLFEVASCFSPREGEYRTAGLAWTGAAVAEHWSGPGRAVDFYDVKGVVEGLAERLGVLLEFAEAAPAFLAAGQSASIGVAGRAPGASVGVVGRVAPPVAAAHDLGTQQPVFVAEIALDRLPELALDEEVAVAPLPRFPAIVRDLSVVVAENLPAATLRDTIRAAAPPTLVSLGEFALYRGHGIEAGRVSLSFRLVFQDPERTLTDDEVQRATETIVRALERRHEARLR